MIPSLVVNEVRDALVEFLSSTFALTDDDARKELDRFLRDPEDGIFRGPYLHLRTPFETVGPNWRSPVDWRPSWMAEPYDSVGDVKGRLVLALQCQAVTLAGTVLLLARFQIGGSLKGSVLPAAGAHAVDAVALMLLVTGLVALTLAAGLVAMPAGAVLLGVSVGELAFGGAVMSASGMALYGAGRSGVAFEGLLGGVDSSVGDRLSATVADLAERPAMVMNEGRAIGGEWEDGKKPPPPLDAELDEIVEHAWEKHVVDEKEFPEIDTPEELKELLEEVVEQATEWGYREDGSVYWYDDVTDTVVIKNPPGIGGSTYRPRAKDHFDG